MNTTPEGYPSDAWGLLSQRLTATRRAKMEGVVARRTRQVRLVLQDLYDFHNIAACLRSAEAFGVLHVDVVDRKSRFLNSTASRGAKDWLMVTRWPSELECAQGLHALGYHLIGAYPDQGAVSLPQVAIDKPIAVIFGNEHEGLSPAWDGLIDQRFTIPMYGMVESFNISVAAAITLYDLTLRGRSEPKNTSYLLSPTEQRDVLCAWVCRSNPHFVDELARLRAKSP